MLSAFEYLHSFQVHFPFRVHSADLDIERVGRLGIEFVAKILERLCAAVYAPLAVDFAKTRVALSFRGKNSTVIKVRDAWQCFMPLCSTQFY